MEAVFLGKRFYWYPPSLTFSVGPNNYGIPTIISSRVEHNASDATVKIQPFIWTEHWINRKYVAIPSPTC